MHPIYPSEFKSLSLLLWRRYHVRTHTIAEALGCSRRTVWRWIVHIKGGKLGRRGWQRKFPCSAPFDYTEDHIKARMGWWSNHHNPGIVREAFRRLIRWMVYRDSGGHLDLIACAEGEEPP